MPIKFMHLTLQNPKILSDIVTIISELVTEVRIKINKEEEILGVNLNNLKAVLRRCKPGAALVLQKQENMLNLGIKDRVKRDFSLALIEIDAEEKDLPSWEFNSVVHINSDTFVEVIEDCAIVSDACTFIAEPNKFVVEAQ